MALNSNVVAPVVISLSRSGEAVAHKVAKALDIRIHGREGRVEKADAFFADALEHVRDLFAAGTPVIGVCASGILIRAVAPLLADKNAEPAVVSVSDDGSVVVPLLGGHRGANRLAREISEALGGVAAVTTAGDVSLGISLDEPPKGYRLENPGDAKAVMAGLLSDQPYFLDGTWSWLEPLASFENVTVQNLAMGDGTGDFACLVPAKDGKPDFRSPHLMYWAQDATLGLGCARNADPDKLWDLVVKTCHDGGPDINTFACVATIDLKADEPAILSVADRLGVPLRLFSAAELESQAQRLANPSDVVFAEVGCHGVSEGAALISAGDTAELLIEKTKSNEATCAIARSPHPIVEMRGRSRGKLSVVGIGPGQAAWRTPEASKLTAEADELVGYGLYIDLLGPLAAGKPRQDFPLGGEEARCRYALERAGEGHNVALICSGDAGIYAMGALVFELLDRGPDEMGVSDAAHRVEVVNAPGVSALQAAAARAGAPLGHDFCAISLSDLLTPREDILLRIKAAAEGDFVIAFYNPVSKRRRDLLALARDILLDHRPNDCPVMLASSLGRPEEELRYRRLDELQVDEVDMLTVVLIGSSHSKLAKMGEGPRMYTPRGYARRIDGDLAV